MPTPDAIAAATKFRRVMLSQESGAIQRLSITYSRLQAKLVKMSISLSNEVETLQKTQNGRVSITKLRRLHSFQVLLEETEHELSRFAIILQEEVRRAAADSAALGIKHGTELIKASFPPLPETVVNQLMKSLEYVQPDAISAVGELISDESPLIKKLEKDYSKAVAAEVGDSLLSGVATGLNPRVTAQLLQKALGQGLSWGLSTIRTAQIKAYQLANHAQYQANPHLIKEWVWTSALDDATCMSCIVQHGKRYPISKTLNDHHNGRCVPLPVPISYRDLGLDIKDPEYDEMTGVDWFKTLSPDQQLKHLGPGKYDAWKAGKFKLADLSGHYQSDVYGDLRREVPLKLLLK